MENETVVMERKHHPLGPSGLQNVEACPCYQGKQDVIHERAIIGTRAHKVTEAGEDDLRLSDDDAAAAAECMDFLERRKQLLTEARQRAVKEKASELNLAAWGGDVEKANTWDAGQLEKAEVEIPPVRELSELKVRVDDEELILPVYYPDKRTWITETLPCTTSGYFDRALIDHAEEYAELFDWKFGLHAVEKAENNVQGICYALGLLRDYPKLKRVRVWFKQPLIAFVTSVEFFRAQVEHLALRVKTIVARAVEARKRIIAGDWSMARPYDPVCTFCVHLGRCPAVCGHACQVAHKFFPLEIPADITPTAALDPKNSSLALRLARVVKTWAEAFKHLTTERVLRGDAPLPEGYVLQHRTGNREVVDVKGFRNAALHFVTEDELTKATRFAIGDVEEIIKDRAPRGQKKAEVDRFKDLLVESKCVQPGDPYSFLRIAGAKGEETTNIQKE